MPVDYFSKIAIQEQMAKGPRPPTLRSRGIAKDGDIEYPLSFATERAMFLTFERLSTCNEAGRHREFRCPRCEQWPQLVKLEPNAGCLFECRCGVQTWDRAFEENSK